MKQVPDLLLKGMIVLPLLLNGCTSNSQQITIEHKAEKNFDFFVPSEKDNVISIVDLQSNRVSAEIKTGETPANIIFIQEFGKAFVTHLNGNTVGVIDLQRMNMTKEIKVGDTPHGMALNQDQKQLYVTTIGDQYVYVIDTEKEEVSRRIDLGSGARTNYPYLHSNRLYVTDHENLLVYVIENDQVIDKYKVNGRPMVAKTSNDGKLLYVATSNYKALEVFDTNTGQKVKEIESGLGVTDFVISDNESLLVATNKEENSVSIIDLNTDKILKKVKGLAKPKHISFNRDKSKVYFTLSGTNKVAAIDMKSLELVDDEIEVGRSPHGIQLRDVKM